MLAALMGCDKGAPAAQTPETAVEAPVAEAAVARPETDGAFAEAGAQTELIPITLGPFTIKSLHVGELALGHFNLYIEGGEPAVVRAWVGDEAATKVLVTKAEFEVDHHCAHIEVPNPLPADAKLWVELETAEGTRLKGSTSVQ